ncbi:TadE/TadG family type IV pilus assembly protein [Methylobacterium sp. C33D]
MTFHIKLIGTFRRNSRGVAAVEFALILPILVAIYFGTAELTRMVGASRKLSLFARTVADLSGQAGNEKPSTDDMAAIAKFAAVVMRPLDTSNIITVVNAMGVEAINGVFYGGVCSSWPQNARPVLQINGTGGLPATPATYQFDGARYILAEVTMPYTPLIGSSLYKWIFGPQGLTFKRQISWAEREGKEVVMPGGSKCPVYN